MGKLLKEVALFVGTIVLMLVGGFAMFSLALTIVMRLGSKYHDIYDYYGYTYPLSTGLFIIGTTAFGFVAPAVIVWRLHKSSWQVSLRALFITMTVAAVLVAIYACTSSW